MRVIVSDAAADLIDEHGGRLYVWPKRSRCCNPATFLVTSETAKAGTAFRQVADEPFEVYVPEQLARLPDELHVEVRRFPRRVEAYWNGCAWIV